MAIVRARAIPPGDASLVVRRLADLLLSIPVGLVSRRHAGGPAGMVVAVREHLKTGLRHRRG